MWSSIVPITTIVYHLVNCLIVTIVLYKALKSKPDIKNVIVYTNDSQWEYEILNNNNIPFEREKQFEKCRFLDSR